MTTSCESERAEEASFPNGSVYQDTQYEDETICIVEFYLSRPFAYNFF